MIDFHSHILPGIDDGANDIEESLAMLASLREQGVTRVVATPHYMWDCSVDGFLEKRNKAYEKLKSAMEADDKEYPDIIMGAEVAVCEQMLKYKHPERLCIDGTNYLLAEMPVKFWEPYLYHVLYTLSAQNRLNIIIAHVDRYFSSFGSNNKIVKLIGMQPVFQITAPALMHHKGRKLLKWLDEFDAKLVLGSDCHNMTFRKPWYSEPVSYISKKYGAEYVNEMHSLGEKILFKE